MMRPRRVLIALTLIASLIGLSACGERRGSYNPFGSPDNSQISGKVDVRPLNGK